MSILSNNPPGPDKAKIVASALRERLLRDHLIDADKIDVILAHAVETLSIRMTPNGWAVSERDASDYVAAARERPGWTRQRTVETPPESAMDKLKRANRESSQGAVKRNADGSYSPAE